MIYKEILGKKLSTLGMGVMRMPVTSPNGPIDMEKSTEIIKYAYDSGINYFDTAYFYHGGESEPFIGKVLKEYPRDSWYLASKFPAASIKRVDGKLMLNPPGGGEPAPFTGPAQIFEEQLKKCGVDYFDFYLLHNLSEGSYGIFTDPEIGIVDYLLEQKKAGRIRHLGLSSHGRAETIDKFLNWRDCFEFVQIQLNYLDWAIQEADKKYDVITKHGLPVIVMEPCRGGKLASLNEKQAQILSAVRPGASQASWAFRFVKSLPNVAVTLSGMTTMEQLKENIEIFSNDDPITESDRDAINRVVASMAELVSCTACRYCCESCPQKLDIPKLLSMYNEAGYELSWSLNTSMNAMKAEEKPQACIACGACKPLCPQGIDIPQAMRKFNEMILENEKK